MKKTLALMAALGCCAFALSLCGCSSDAAPPPPTATTDDGPSAGGGGTKAGGTAPVSATGAKGPSANLSRPAPPTK